MTNNRRNGISDSPFPKTVYRIPNPEWGVSECYEISIEIVHGAPDPKRCWIVREVHGYYEDSTRLYHHKFETLHPNEPRHFLTLGEALRAASQHVLFRAEQGFRFLFTLNYEHPPWYSRFEVVLPAGEIKQLP